LKDGTKNKYFKWFTSN